MNHFKVLTIFLVIILFTSCEKKIVQVEGYLKGKISIGPICPVETSALDSACMATAETYKTYPVSVFTNDGLNKITQISPELNGSFMIYLYPGNYILKLEAIAPHAGGSNLPMKVIINSQDTTSINIDIDTGIR